LSSAYARYFIYLLIVAGLLILGNQKYLFLDEEERRIVDVLPHDPPQIPTLYNAEFTGSGSTYLGDDSLVVGVHHEGVAKAYPVQILNRHEVVNDFLGREPIIVSFCPLTGSPLVFSREPGTTFGVSGKLYKNNLVLYDNASDSLWSQIHMRCIKGESKGTDLEVLPSHLMQWGSWRTLFPDTQLMLPPDVFTLDEYRTDSYEEYRASPNAGVFPLDNQDFSLENKEYVLGVNLDGTSKAYRVTDLSTIRVLMDEVGETSVVVTCAYGSAQAFEAGGHTFKANSSLTMLSEDGGHWNMATGQRLDSEESLRPLRYLQVYWFAWYDFYPGTLLLVSGDNFFHSDKPSRLSER